MFRKFLQKISIHLLSTTGMGIAMLAFFFTALILTVLDLQHTQLINSHAANPQQSVHLSTHFSKGKFHHPLRILKPVQTPQFSTRAKIAPFAAGFSGYAPADIKKAYNLPATGGNGTIAILDPFDTPNAEHDLNAFSTQFGLPSCTKASGCFTVHYQSGIPPGQNANWQLETNLDIEWAHAIAPNAKILLIELNSDSDVNNVLVGLDYARNQSDVVAISMSFGATEASDEQNADTSLTSPFGAAFFAATGDSGSGTSWPAVSTKVIAVGGTSLQLNNNVFTESAWSGSSGGLSQFIAEPGYQTTYGIPNANGKRGIPDVAMVADPNTGCLVYGPDGQWYVIGGTSLATPIWAGISALGNTPLTLNRLYQNAKSNYPGFYRDITSGTNGTCTTYCSATTGYDYVTGLGSPIALPLSNGVTATPTPTPTFTPTPTPSPTSSPTPTNTPTPTFTPAPTISPSPTPTPNPNATTLSFSVGLHDIGNGGDNVSLSSQGNMNPRHPIRQVTVAIFDLQNNLKTQATGSIIFDTTSGLFKGTVNLGTLPTGDYELKIKTDGFLAKFVYTIFHITANAVTTIPQINLVNGDVDNNNQLDIQDYNILVNCFGSKQNTSTCTKPPTSQVAGTDLDDSGTVDAVDYNIFIREISVQPGN